MMVHAYNPSILAVEDQQFKVILDYIGSLGLAWSTGELLSHQKLVQRLGVLLSGKLMLSIHKH